MKNRPVMLWKIALAPEAVKLPPAAATGMAIHPQIVEPQPPAIVTVPMGAKVHGGIHSTGAAMRWRHGIRPYRRGESAAWSRAHTTHSGTCMSGLQRVWALWHAWAFHGVGVAGGGAG
jgi:hypothetical protein